jgi:DNA-binding NarL/FixJ family response regulator
MGDGSQLIDSLHDLTCDILLLDINMPNVDGIQALKALRRVHHALPVIMVSTYANAEFLGNVMAIGISGYLSKNTSKENLYQAIETALEGKQFWDDAIKPFVESVEQQLSKETRKFNLSGREMDVLKCLAKGKTSAETAGDLSISVFTVETHKKNILLKLNLHNLAEMVKYATERGLV